MPKIPSFHKSNLAQQLHSAGREEPKLIPLWKGPEEDGLTQSLLQRYIACKERFRVRVMEGLVANEGFNVRLGYGNMWHTCEEAHAANRPWLTELKDYCQGLLTNNPEWKKDVDKWFQVCKVQFPHYVDFWKNQSDVLRRNPLLQEGVFRVNYRLPSGRVVVLRGKFDSVDAIGGEAPGIYLQENKSKGDIRPLHIQRQLTFDLQTMLYFVALSIYRRELKSDLKEWKLPIRGVRYNVIRRPLSGGKYTISPHKAKSTKAGKHTPAEMNESYFKRLSGLIEKDKEHFFIRWKVEITPRDVERFKEEFFNPELENLLDDYEWWNYAYRNGENVYDYIKRGLMFPLHQRRHARYPFGTYNILDEGGSSDLDEYLIDGKRSGLHKAKTLFPELE